MGAAIEVRLEGAATVTEVAPVDVVGVVYIVTNLLNGKQYVGQTRTSIEAAERDKAFPPEVVAKRVRRRDAARRRAARRREKVG